MAEQELQRFVLNATGVKVRRETLEGRKYLVVPVVMLTEGVHKGSRGPLYYPKEELSKTPEVWNHKPIVIYHPEMNGKPISACKAEVMESRKVGIILNAKWDTKLRAEAWLEEEKLARVDPRVMESIEKDHMVEVSTGLFSDNEAKDGRWNGKDYTEIARNYRPDHLAILPDRVGACSIEDGAGLLRTNEVSVSSFLVINEQEGAGAVYDRVRQCRATLRNASYVVPGISDGMVTNAIAHSAIHKGISDAMVEESRGRGEGYWPGWVEDVYDNFFIYNHDGKFYKRAYSTDANYNFKMDPANEPQEIRRHTEWRDMNGSHVAAVGLPNKTDNGPPGLGVSRKHTLNEGQIVADTNNSVPVPAPVPVVPVTLQQYVDAAPADIKTRLQEGIASVEKERTQLVSTIVANKANTMTETQLKDLSMDTLRAFAAVAVVNQTPPPAPAPAPVVPAPVVNQTPPVRPANFGGAAGAPPEAGNGTTPTGAQKDPLTRPTVNWREDRGFSKKLRN